MTGPGVNLAVTKDGEAYNKLQRPQDYLTSANTPPPKKVPLTEAHPVKRKHEHIGAPTAHKRIRTEPEFGMRTCLPGSDGEEHLSDDSIGEALAYLRNVRSEALAIPHLLVGKTAHNSYEAPNDPTVLFREGTWIALNEQGVVSHDDETSEKHYALGPQDRLYQLLLKRFYNLRKTLASANEKKHTHTTRIGHTIEVEREHSKLSCAWPDLMDKAYPKFNELLQLDEATVYEGLQHCADSIDRAGSLSPYTSCWIWSLLASIGDVGTLDNEKISNIRYLGQRLGVLGARLGKGSLQCQYMDEGDLSAGKNQPARHSHENKDEKMVPTQAEALLHSAVVENDKTDACLSPTGFSGSDAEMSMSGDEDSVHYDTEVNEVERARARLLKQLGDRLVHSQPPPRETMGRVDRHNPEMREQNLRSFTLQAGTDSKSSGIALGDGKSGGSTADWAALNTRATIDMVLTIVAECFGQRDLLRYRWHW